MTTIYLVRHAHSDWTEDENRPLSERGLEDAGRVSEFLGELSLTAIYSSPALRARQTVAPLASRIGLSVQEIDDLQERVLGRWAGDDFEAAVRMTCDDLTFSHPDGETNQAAQARGVAIVQGIVSQHEGEQIVIASHGNLLALVLQHFDQTIGFYFWQSMTMPDIYRLDISAAGMASINRVWS
jgi:2,3-bisphosphoglycerate-dependent phosphoglycerate mutase